MKRYRVEISGVAYEIDAGSKSIAVDKILHTEDEREHIKQLLERYGRYTIFVKEVEKK